MFILDTLLPIFAKTVLPVFLVAGGGLLLAWRLELDSRTLGRVIFYLGTPSLVFRSLYRMEVDLASMQRLALVAALVAVATATLGWLLTFDQPRDKRAALTLTSGMPNNGNMGIPISYFAFGDVGLALGSLYYVVSSFLSNTFGVVVASAGQAPLIVAVRQSLRVPVLYAAVLGLLINRTGVEMPLPLFRAVDLLADMAIPGMLVLLGIQLRHAPIRERQWVIMRASAIRLLAAPVLAYLLCNALGVGGVERNVITLQAAMPTAVMAAVLATEYDAAPRLVATVIFFTTILSMITLSLVLWYIL